MPLIKSVVWPSGISHIGDKAFYECKNLINVTLQEGLESIGDWCFSNT